MIEAIVNRRGYRVTQEQSKKITGAGLFLIAALISFGGLGLFFALGPGNQ